MQVHVAFPCAYNGVWKSDVPLVSSINCSENSQYLSDNQLPDLVEHKEGQSRPVSLKEKQSLPIAEECVFTMQILSLNVDL